MAGKRDLTNVTISLPNFHLRKLTTMTNKLGVTRSGVIQRLIESQSIFTLGEPESKTKKES